MLESKYEQNRREAALFYCSFPGFRRKYDQVTQLCHKTKGLSACLSNWWRVKAVRDRRRWRYEKNQPKNILSAIVSFIQRIGLNTIVSFVGVYAVIVSVLYLYGYWSSFNFDAFEYLGLSDPLIHAIFFVAPMILSLLGFAVASYLTIPYSPFEYILLSLYLLPLAFLLPQTVRWYYLKPFLYITGGVAFFFFVYDGVTGKLNYDPRPELGNSVYAKVVRIVTLVPVLFPSRTRLLRFVLTLVFFIPTAAYTLGRLEAKYILDGGGTLFVDLSKSAQLLVDRDRRVSYLGRLGDVFVLYEATSKRLIIVPTYEFQRLVLMPAAGNNSTKPPSSSSGSMPVKKK